MNDEYIKNIVVKGNLIDDYIVLDDKDLIKFVIIDNTDKDYNGEKKRYTVFYSNRNTIPDINKGDFVKVNGSCSKTNNGNEIEYKIEAREVILLKKISKKNYGLEIKNINDIDKDLINKLIVFNRLKKSDEKYIQAVYNFINKRDINLIDEEKLDKAINETNFLENLYLSDSQKDVIIKGLNDNIPISKLKSIAVPQNSPEKMEKYIEGFKSNLNFEDIKLYIDEDFSPALIEIIKEDIKDDIDKDIISLYAKKDMSISQIEQIRIGIDQGLSKEEIEKYADPKYDEKQMEIIREIIKEDKLEEFEKFLNPIFPSDIMSEIYKIINLESDIKHYILVDINMNYRKNKGANLYNFNQLKEIRIALENNLDYSKIGYFLDPIFSAEKMKIVREAIENNISTEIINLLANPKKDIRVLKEAKRKALRGGSVEEISNILNN